ncbi:MAG: homoserine kinase [Cytophagales bacterium]|nr:homoserine kinase [Cytophagales bacterium]
MGKSIKAFAPATAANVACGFDVLGFAVENPGDEVTLTLKDEPGIIIKSITGDEGKLPLDAEKNTVSLVIQEYLNHIGSNQGVEIELRKLMPLKSGLGSSAASSVVGVYALNKLLGSPLKDEELLPFAMEGERLACGSAHADNVAPALLGGFVLIRSYEPLDVIQLPTPDDLYATIIHPHVEVKTKDARNILRKEVELSKAIQQWGNLAGLIAGLMKSDYDLIGRSLQDVIVEPVRALLIPGFDEAKQAALDAGALGSSISGSGPSIFALSKGAETASKVGQAMKEVYQKWEIESEVYISKVSQQGPRIIE